MSFKQLTVSRSRATETSVRDPRQLARHLDELGNAIEQVARVTNANNSAIFSATTLFGAYASRPSAGIAGRRYVCSDGAVEFVDDGKSWRPLVAGIPGTEVAPKNILANWNQVGTAPTSTAVTGGCPFAYWVAAAGSPVSGFEISFSANRTFVAAIYQQARFVPASSTAYDGGRVGIWVRDAAGGKLISFMVGNDTNAPLVQRNVIIQNRTNLTTFSSTPYDQSWSFATNAIVWLKIVATGAALQFSVSSDGVNWIQVYQDAVTFLGAANMGNRFGWGAQHNEDSALSVISAQVL